MSKLYNFKDLLYYCYNLYILLYGIISSIYTVYIKNILLYYRPLEIKLVFENVEKKIKNHNKLKSYDPKKYIFFYKINKVSYNNGKFYNFGYYYHTSIVNSNFFNPEPSIAFSPEIIQSVLIVLKKKDNINNCDTYSIVLKDNIKHKFISNILFCATRDSILSILIYYYLQKYLNNYDIISNVKLEIDSNYYIVNYNNTLGEIYDKLENELD